MLKLKKKSSKVSGNKQSVNLKINLSMNELRFQQNTVLPCTCKSVCHTSVQFSRSVVSDSLQPHERSTPGLPVHHQHPEFTQTHVHRVSDAIQPSHPQLSPSPPAPNPSQHQSVPMSQLFT